MVNPVQIRLHTLHGPARCS